MSGKFKIGVIISSIFIFIIGWVILVISFLGKNNENNDIITNNQQLQNTTGNQITNNNQNIENPTTGNNTQQNTLSSGEQLDEWSLNVLYPDQLFDLKSEKIFNLKLKKSKNGNLVFDKYSNLEEYHKELVYKLAMKEDDFDLAIIPSEWFDDITELSNTSFKIPNLNFQISTLFDYNFTKYLQDNKIKAIPFAIDPILGFAYKSGTIIDKEQSYDTRKYTIISDSDRLSTDGKIKTMPIFLGYDNDYLKYLVDGNETKIPIFDYIFSYYVYVKAKNGIQTIKSFGNEDLSNKTFDNVIYTKHNIVYGKKDFCKKHIGFCILLDQKTSLVYDFASSLEFFTTNNDDIEKKFKIGIDDITKTTLALEHNTDDYPARGWIIIINPNIKDMKNVGNFMEYFIEMGKEHNLPFYSNTISPFVGANNKKLDVISPYVGRFVFLDEFVHGHGKYLTETMLDYLTERVDLNALIGN